MNTRSFVLAGAVFLSALTAFAQQESSKLDVEVSYTGSGTVDESHKIFVVLWDTPDFMKGDSAGPPAGVQSVSSKSGVAHFDSLPKGPVYVSMVYDPSGKWDAASVPPSGCSVGLYATEPGKPEPIQLPAGKLTKVSASFDDSMKIP